MLDKEQRIKHFAILGDFLLQWSGSESKTELPKSLEAILPEAESAIGKAFAHNGWFIDSYVRQALYQWGSILTEENLESWVGGQDLHDSPKRVGIIMAGNVPLVGFHDLLSVLITGNHALVKMSREDEQLLPIIFKALETIDPQWEEQYTRVPKLTGMDAVIATGSNNTARYFSHYFGGIPHIIRKNRNSVALLTGEESDEELHLLGRDIFLYFGLGCRNVTKLYLPESFDLNRIFGNILPYSDVVQNNKYGNNYDYHRAIFMMNRIPFLENGFVILNENRDLASPVSVLHYERYKDLSDVKSEIDSLSNEIQCVVGTQDAYAGAIPFGDSQRPGLDDYADGVNILEFLRSLT